METEPPGSEITVAVSYPQFAGTPNPDLRGKGTLTIGAAEPLFRFTGKAASLFGRAATLEFSSDQIWNVLVAGPKIQFETRVGKAGKQGKPFSFECPTPAVAAGLAQLLPATKDHVYEAKADFARKLQQLPAPAAPWESSTNLIIAANVAVFVIMGCLGAGWVETADMKPYVLYVANNAGATTDGEWWRLFTSMFVHYGILHLALNMWALFQIGHFVEKLFGRPLFTFAYFGSGLIASFTSLFWNGDRIWSAGASGAIFGVYGMLLGYMLRQKQAIPSPVLRPMLRSTLGFAGYNLLYGMAHAGIDNAAHLGGLVGGFALGWVTALPLEPELREDFWRLRLRRGVELMVVVMAAGIWFAPRYDYHFREEVAFADANQELGAKEAAFLPREQAALEALQRGQGADDFRRLIETEAFPLYDRWRGSLRGLSLEPGKVTDQRRALLVALLDSKIANYNDLLAGIRAKDPNAVDRYQAAEKRAMVQAQGAPVTRHR